MRVPAGDQRGSEAERHEPGPDRAYRLATDAAVELGRLTRRLREQRGWTQVELAHAAGMALAAVARFEAGGGAIPTLPVLTRLADALDADVVIGLAPRDPSG